MYTAVLKTAHRNKKAVSYIVRQYRILAGSPGRPATLREFAEKLSQALRGLELSISYQSIKNWQDGQYLPNTFLMMRLAQVARQDWRGEFAADILAALHPQEYQPLTEIGRRALRSSDEIRLTRGNYVKEENGQKESRPGDNSYNTYHKNHTNHSR